MLAIYLAALDSADNAEAFEAVYERYKRLVYHVACQIVHDPHLAEDVAQEVFLYIAKTLPACTGRTRTSLRLTLSAVHAAGRFCCWPNGRMPPARKNRTLTAMLTRPRFPKMR